MQVNHKANEIAQSELPKPRLLGRLVRFLLGLGLASMLWLTSPSELSDPDGLFWLLALYAFLSLPDVSDVLFGRRWQRKSQVLFLILAALAAILDLLLYQQIWAPFLAWLVYGVIVGVLGALTLSYLLSALLRTPGCEWRAIPHLLALVLGREVEVHPCSIYLHKLDQWEADRSANK